MLYLVLGLLLVGIGQISALSDEMQKFSNMLHTVCTNETNVSEDAISNARLGIFADDPELKCYMKCLMVTATLMDEEGRINSEAVIDLVPPPYRHLVRPIVEKCALLAVSANAVDLCDLAFQANVCVQANGPAYYYLA